MHEKGRLANTEEILIDPSVWVKRVKNKCLTLNINIYIYKTKNTNEKVYARNDINLLQKNVDIVVHFICSIKMMVLRSIIH